MQSVYKCLADNINDNNNYSYVYHICSIPTKDYNNEMWAFVQINSLYLKSKITYLNCLKQKIKIKW